MKEVRKELYCKDTICSILSASQCGHAANEQVFQGQGQPFPRSLTTIK